MKTFFPRSVDWVSVVAVSIVGLIGLTVFAILLGGAVAVWKEVLR